MENIKALPPMERPREKLRYQGPQALSDAELLAILFGSGSKGLPVSEICDNLLQQLNWRSMATVDTDTLCKFKGIGEAKATILLAVIELSRRLQQPPPNVFKDATALHALLWPLFEHSAELRYILVLLTDEKELLATADAESMLPYVTWVTDLALEAGAKRIVLARNGWGAFSNAEGRYAEKLKAAASALGIIADGLMVVGAERFKIS